MECEKTESDANGTAAVIAAPSRWEWLPAVAAVGLAVAYFLTAPGAAANRFAFFVALGLIPGIVWRLCGRSSWSIHRICFAISLTAFVLDNPGLRPDRDTLEKAAANWHLVILGCFASFSQPVWGALRIQRLLSDSGVEIGKYDALKLCLSGSFFNMFLPGSTGGDAYRVYAITHSYTAKYAPAIASVTLDRLLGLPSLILVVVLGMLLDYQFFLSNRILTGLIPFIAGAGAICAALVVYLEVAGRTHRRSGQQAAPHSATGKPAGWLRRTHRMIATNVKRPSTLPLTLLYGFLAHVACIVSCQLFGLALGVQGVPAHRYYLIVPMAMTINAIPFAPGGVGQGELAMASLLDMASPGAGNLQVGVMIMLLFRLSNVVMGLVGGVYYALGKTDFKAVVESAKHFEEMKRDSQRFFEEPPAEAPAAVSPPSRDG